MYQFGAGVLIGVPTVDATGAAIANPSPVQFGTLQNVTVTEQWEAKELYGANQFPVAVGRGKGKVMLKAKAATINAQLWNTFVYGLTLASTFQNVYEDLTGTSIPTAPTTITPTLATAQVEDLGVRDGNGTPYTRVASSPTAGQYSLSTGVYTFNAIDFGKKVFINYAYTGTLASARAISVTNQPMGLQPAFECHLRTQYLGKTLYIKYPNAISNNLSRDLKNDDFTIPEFDIQCFVDANNVISTAYFYE